MDPGLLCHLLLHSLLQCLLLALYRATNSADHHIAAGHHAAGQCTAQHIQAQPQRLLAQSDLRMLETSYENLNEAFDALNAGQVEYVCCDLYSGAYLASFYPGINMCGTLDVPTAQGIAVAPDNTTLQVNVQSALDTIQSNGLVQLVRVKWIAGMPNATNASMVQGIE
jgi:polar amino acid transport system substrate-binding protein